MLLFFKVLYSENGAGKLFKKYFFIEIFFTPLQNEIENLL